MPMRWWNQTDIDWETAKSKEGGETDSTSGSGSNTDAEEERKEEADIRGLFQGRGATSIIIWGRDVGGHPKDGTGAKWISTRGG